jgi:long-chain acyl-CoA synthetase
MMFGDTPGEGAHLVAGPMYHAAPGGFAVASIHAGQTLVLMDKWTPEGTLELIDRYDVTNTHLVPTMFHRLLGLSDEVRQAADLSSLRSVIHAAAPCPVDTKRRMFTWLGPIIHEYYGATEGLATVVHPEDWLAHPGTVGQAAMGAELKILDDDGSECPPGTPGTVWIKSAATAFEYHNDPDKTAANRRGDFITAGDIGYLDADGWLFLCDRQADVIIAGGVNIYPAEIEAVLLEHPAVADAAVIGVPHEEWGEEVKAVVQAADGAATDDLASALLAHCARKLARFKLPRSIDFRDSLPRYDTGKLYRRLLRDEYWAGRVSRI